MKIKKIFLVTIFFTLISGDLKIYNSNAITFELSHGRFGDTLLNYMKAKWLSYKYNIPLYYPYFKYSDQLMISEIDKIYNNEVKRKFNKAIKIKKDINLNCKINSKILYISDYYTKINLEFICKDSHLNLLEDKNFILNDKDFISKIQKFIAPKYNIPKPEIPSGRILVAVHVRKGGGFDPPLLSVQEQHDEIKNSKNKKYADVGFPLKFPPDKYYIDQIKKLYYMLNKAPLHIHLFTDHKNPKYIVERYKRFLKKFDITFSYRSKGNRHDQNVIEDFFSMTYYECLIRSESNFAFCADVIGDFLIVISPKGYFWKENNLVIDKVKIRVNMENINKVSNITKTYFLLNKNIEN